MTLKRSSRLLVAHGYSLKQTLLRKVSRRVILKIWYDSTSLENCTTNGSGKETSLTREASVPIPAKGTKEGLWVLNLKAAGSFFSDTKSWSDLRRGKLAALVGIEDFREPTAFLDCGCKRIARQSGVLRIGYRPTKHITRLPVDHRTQVGVAFGYGN